MRIALVALLGVATFFARGAPAHAKGVAKAVPIDWIPYGEDMIGFVVPRGWRVEIGPKHVVAVAPGPSGASLVRRLEADGRRFDAEEVVGRAVATLKEPVVLSRHNGSQHASMAARRNVDGKPHWTQIVADVSPAESGGDRIDLVVFETMDGDQFQRFIDQEAAEVFLTSFHPPLWPPEGVFAGTWEGFAGQASRAISVSADPMGTALDDGWYFRLDLLAGRRYRLTRVVSSTASVSAGWDATTEIGTFEVNANAMTFLRGSCAATRAPGGRPPKAAACGAPLGALLFTPQANSGSMIARGVHLFDDRWGGGQLVLARPNS